MSKGVGFSGNAFNVHHSVLQPLGSEVDLAPAAGCACQVPLEKSLPALRYSS